MASIQKRGDKYQVRIKHRLLPKPLFVTLDTEDAASAYGADYVGLVGMPTGMGVEVVDACALLEAAAEADSAYDREHVCPFLYCRPERFKSIRPECPPSYRLPEARVTVDTAEDYERAVAIVRELGNEPSDEAVIAWLLSRREGR
ncbi:MAG TPA: hypothetical protein PLW80_05570 [Spirochaetales bacterium]|nr:hypothetical protein [Spirochaetales bacterium]